MKSASELHAITADAQQRIFDQTLEDISRSVEAAARSGKNNIEFPIDERIHCEVFKRKLITYLENLGFRLLGTKDRNFRIWW